MKNSYLTVTDQFCGAGGSSQGVRNVSRAKSGGLEVRLALNHWKLAIETHNTNFPETLHDCTDISACDPRRYPKTNILITSPECTNHSLAKGKKKVPDLFTALDPEAERSRATMWDVPRFAEYHDYELIIVENVVEARTWIMWDAWLLAMHRLGYAHKCVYLNSMFCHPTPQSRDRMYVVFWKKGNKAPDLEYRPVAPCPKCEKVVESIQVWRNAAKPWGKYKQQYDYRCACGTVVEPFYYASFNCIDWSIQAPRIGERKKPLAANTIKRIQYGLEKYGRKPVIISSAYNHMPKPLSDAHRTVTGHHNIGLCAPFIINTDHSHMNKCFDRSTMDPMRTQTSAHASGLVVPFIIKNYSGNHKPVSPGDPLSTVTCIDHHAIVDAPFIVENKKTSKARGIDQRLGCVTGINYQAIVTPESFSSFLACQNNGSHVISQLHEAARTQPTKQRLGLVNHSIGEPRLEDCTYRMLKAHEIQAAMAFESDYVVLGNTEQKVKQLGNAVTPPAMEFLIERGIQTFE